MNRRSKLLSIIFVLIFCLSICTLSAYAANGYYYNEEPVTQPVPTEPVPDPTQPPAPDPVPTESPTYAPESSESSYQPSYDPDPQSSYDPGNQESYYESSYYQNDNSYISSQNDNFVAAPISNAEPPSADSNVELYDVKKTVDGKELNSKDWDDIATSLKNAGSLAVGDGDDFSFIKNNNSSSDNGDWMLYAGIACILLSLAGIAYVIVSNVNNHKKASVGGHSVPAKRRPVPAKRRPVPASAGANRYRNDYSDNYSSQPRKTNRVSAERRSKFDTADVKLPRQNGNNGGRRYR